MLKPTVQPAWMAQPPPEGTFRAIFKWGAPGRFHHPKAGLIGFIQKHLDLSDQQWTTPRQTGLAPATMPEVLDRTLVGHAEPLAAIVGPGNVQADDFSRLRYAHGQSAEEIMRLRAKQPKAATGLVVHPRHEEDVRAIVNYCHHHHLPITVFGGGSSVTLGVKPGKSGITLVMRTHMHRVLDFNETNQTITVEAGILGPAYEACLNQAPEHFKSLHRYTGGHFPQSFEFSTVGGWIAALGAGQQSSYYGDMCDLVVSQNYVTPVGSICTADYPATATGPKVNDIMKGSEGAFGVLTSATLKVFRWMPDHQRRFAFMMPDWHCAVDAARQISQGEFGMPSMLRISDAEETDAAMHVYGLNHPVVEPFLKLRGYEPMKRCLIIGQCDGEKHFARHAAHQSKKICRRRGGLWLSGYPVKRWAKSRFLDPYMRDDLFDMGVLIDTLETAVTWDKLEQVHAHVRKLIKGRPHTLCLTHASHFYPQGTNLYFIFITPMMAVDDYCLFQKKIIDAILRAGGSLSHHHGTGKLMGPWMESHLGREQMAVIRALKHHFDPHNIMNPGGTLGLDSV